MKISELLLDLAQVLYEQGDVEVEVLVTDQPHRSYHREMVFSYDQLYKSALLEVSAMEDS